MRRWYDSQSNLPSYILTSLHTSFSTDVMCSLFDCDDLTWILLFYMTKYDVRQYLHHINIFLNKRDKLQPYLIRIRCHDFCLLSLSSSYFSVKYVNHVDDPFSWFNKFKYSWLSSTPILYSIVELYFFVLYP